MKQSVKKQLHREKYYLGASLFLLVFLAFLYIYFLSMSVTHVVLRKEVDREKNNLYSEISRLEAAYITKQHSMTNEIASLQGFISAEEKIFIQRSDDSLVLSSNNIR